ncbi:MAG: class I SAM-dependent methyltransferase [Planctomycetes bacterium]|nr:class I SAM-dependent methyltransferase [Planctomycetota bacterium]
MPDDRGQDEDTGWWRNHFSGILLDLWQSIVPTDQAARDADFLQAECRLPPGAKILDVPCGDGRVALELAGRGFRLVGVDIAAGLIREARRRAEQRRLDVELHEADMRCLPWEREFDAAFCWGDSFGYMDDAGNQQFLAAVHRTLRPGGRWAMEMQMIAEVLLPRYRGEGTGEAGGIQVRIQRAYDARQGRLRVEYALSRDGNEERRTASYRIYTCAEVCRMLERAGFVIDRLYGGARESFQIGSDRLRVVAARQPKE